MSKQEKKVLVPALRFPEFRDAGEWSTALLGNKKVSTFVKERVALDELSLDTYVSTENLLPDYAGVSRACKLPPSGSFTRYKKGDVLISNIRPYLKKVWSADKAGASSNDVVVVRSGEKIVSEFLTFVLKNDEFINYVMKGAKGVKMPRGDISSMKEYPVAYPKDKEQQKIADCLSTIDELVTAQTQKVETLKTHKKGLMQQLFPAEGETVPKLRFPEFRDAGEWDEKTLGNITNKTDKKNKEGKDYPIYSINNKVGFVPQTEQFDGVDSNKRGYDITLYKVIGKNTFAYNPARINVGSIGYSGELNDIIISSLYVCFKSVDNVNDVYLQQFFNTAAFNESVNNNVEGGIRNYLFYENFSRIKIPLPKPEEQQKIADCLSSIDDLITAQTKKVEALKAHKKGLMQQLFPTAEAVAA